MPRTSRKEQIQDGGQEQQNEEEGSQTRGSTRAKRTTGLSTADQGGITRNLRNGLTK